MTYNAHKQSCMSPHSDNNKSHHIMWLMGLPTLRQCCFFRHLCFFYASSYSELQGVRPREDMTTLVRTNLLHPLFSSPETSPTQWEMGPVWPFNSPLESSRKKDRYVSSSLSLPPLCCHCAHQSCLETFTNTFFLSMATGCRRGKGRELGLGAGNESSALWFSFMTWQMNFLSPLRRL